MKKIKKIVDALAYLLLNVLDWIKGKIRYRTWGSPSLVVYKHYAAFIRDADVYQHGAEAVARIITYDNTQFVGPTDQVGGMCGKYRIKLLRMVFDRIGKRNLDDACLSLFHNVVNRYWNEFCVYPDNQIRTASLRPGDVFIDVGAFRGYVSLKAANKVGDAGHVISIEPMQQNCTYIEIHRELNGLSNWEILTGVASTLRSDSADIYFTSNQVNSLLNKNIPNGADVTDVTNYNIVALLEDCISNRANNKRIIISVTTNGDEMELILDCLRTPGIDGLDYLQFIIPIIYTRREISVFKSKADDIHDRLIYIECYPWLSISLATG